MASISTMLGISNVGEPDLHRTTNSRILVIAIVFSPRRVPIRAVLAVAGRPVGTLGRPLPGSSLLGPGGDGEGAAAPAADGVGVCLFHGSEFSLARLKPSCRPLATPYLHRLDSYAPQRPRVPPMLSSPPSFLLRRPLPLLSPRPTHVRVLRPRQRQNSCVSTAYKATYSWQQTIEQTWRSCFLSGN